MPLVTGTEPRFGARTVRTVYGSGCYETPAGISKRALSQNLTEFAVRNPLTCA